MESLDIRAHSRHLDLCSALGPRAHLGRDVTSRQVAPRRNVSSDAAGGQNGGSSSLVETRFAPLGDYCPATSASSLFSLLAFENLVVRALLYLQYWVALS